MITYAPSTTVAARPAAGLTPHGIHITGVRVLEAAGVTGAYFSHMAHGASSNICVSARHIQNWAALDQRRLADLSAEERAALFGGVGEMVADSERRILQFRADLSN